MLARSKEREELIPHAADIGILVNKGKQNIVPS
jgi:hypothetical protein